MAALSEPLQQVHDLLLAYYASKGKYPRPNDVTQADIDNVQRLCAVVARDLTTKLAVPKRNNGGLEDTIRQLDRQIDIYEDSDLLVSLMPFS